MYTRPLARGWLYTAAAMLPVLAGCRQDDLPTGNTAPLLSPGTPVLSTGTPDILISTTADDGPGSLRQAIADVPDGGVIVIGFEPALSGGTITLATALLIDDKSVTIQGPADRGITIDGDGITNLFHVFVGGELTLRNATLTGARHRLGALFTAGTVRIENSTIAGNRAAEEGSSGDGYGGGIRHVLGDLTLVNSTVSGNTSDQRGGGIASTMGSLDVGSITLIHSTVTGNSVPDDHGGGIYSEDPGLSLTIQNSIIAGNSAGAGEPNCDYDLGSDLQLVGTNLMGDSGCEPRPEDIVAADPVLGSLADNGGPTRTHALLPGSPAIETAVQACSSVATDQRYVTRPQGGHCDIGAFEFEGFITPPLSIDAGGTVSPTSGSTLVSGRITCPAPATLTLRVTLRQTQKIARVNTVVEATADVPVTCSGSKPWGVALAPATGGFRSGTGTVTARTLNGPVYLQNADATRSVKLGWGRK